jgi:3-hydroxyisobutyrate dehydrogenase-like beta-hydroxyacid dehydrogenase
VAIAEALVWAVKAGLDPQMVYDVVRASTGTSWDFETRVPRILARDFSPGGTIDISYKDSRRSCRRGNSPNTPARGCNPLPAFATTQKKMLTFFASSTF